MNKLNCLQLKNVLTFKIFFNVLTNNKKYLFYNILTPKKNQSFLQVVHFPRQLTAFVLIITWFLKIHKIKNLFESFLMKKQIFLYSKTTLLQITFKHHFIV